MKKIKRMKMFAPVILLLMGLTGCYYEGGSYRHGDVYLALEPDQDRWVKYYWDNNPSVPEQYEWGYFYPTESGLFEYEYALGDGWVYYGTYYLERELGNAGGPGYASSDGQDRYYSFYCYSGGGFSDYMYLRSQGVDRSAQVLTDTVIDFGGYDMKITRNRIREEDFVSEKTPKYVHPDVAELMPVH